MDFSDYIRAFNTGDDAALVRNFYAPDVHFQSGPRILRGADELLQFLNWAHDGIREIIRAQTVLRDENRIFAEIDMDFHATKDKPDFTFGALKKGEFTTVKFFVLYSLREGKVARFKAATWPPNLGVTKPDGAAVLAVAPTQPPAVASTLASSAAPLQSAPGARSDTSRLGGTPEGRQAFMDYTRAFSNADFEGFSRFYTDDVRCELPSAVLERREGIVSFYGEMFKTVRESLTLHQLIADDAGLAADVTSQFTAIEEAPHFVVAPLKKGEFVRVRVFVYYTLRDGKIANIRVARAGTPSKPQRL
ncbi:MAG TPA: nuclear transport factor 2 family protein [Steroidobacteraceae bacterium]|nr:nuclear transport factor 2 family protein [Steroidobacteraceae bacterium]